MPDLGRELVLQALQATGAALAVNGETEAIQVVLCGSMAGILGGHLPAERQTLDCDVIASQPSDRFPAIAAAAANVAHTLDLSPQWLNNESRVFAWRLPVGWKERLHTIGRFGPLTVTAVSRRDLMALKLVGAAKRPQDLEDLDAMKPDQHEAAFLHRYLDQSETESLDRASYDHERALLNELMAQP